MDIPRISELDVQDRRVLVRADLNVPLREGKVADDSRIRAVAPTIRDILDRGGKVILIAHLGRPKGQRDPDFSLKPLVGPLSRILDGARVEFAEDCVGKTAEAAVAKLAPGECLLLENLRFHPGEKENDDEFAAALARLGDIYVNDAFSASHRDHASITGIPGRIPAAAGLLMEKELGELERLLSDPKPPYVAFLGGAKANTKIPVIEHLLDRADRIMLGGVMANTFLMAQGRSTGRSKVAEDSLDAAKATLDAAAKSRTELLLPEDLVVAAEMTADAETQVVAVDAVPDDMMILDIGPETIRRYIDAIGDGGTVVWNGTMGAAELEPFERGSHFIAAALAERGSAGGLTTVAGGGDTVAFLHKHQMWEMFTYNSMAGGAFLRWLSGAPLPGVTALAEARREAAS